MCHCVEDDTFDTTLPLATKYKIQFNVLLNMKKLLSCTFMINCNKQRCHCSSQNSNTHTHASSHGGCQHQSSIQIQGGSRIFCPFANLLRCQNLWCEGNEDIDIINTSKFTFVWNHQKKRKNHQHFTPWPPKHTYPYVPTNHQFPSLTCIVDSTVPILKIIALTLTFYPHFPPSQVTGVLSLNPLFNVTMHLLFIAVHS